jgi:hypothetical protein
MSLTTPDVKRITGQLADFLVNQDFSKLLESQGSLDEYNKKINDLRSSTFVLNKEFEERHNTMTPYKLPIFGTNQDIILLAFYFSYAFLLIVSLVVVYKNTQSIQNTAYAFFLALALLLIITAILIRVA